MNNPARKILFNKQIEIFLKYINETLDEFDKSSIQMNFLVFKHANEEPLSTYIEDALWNNASNFPNLLKKSTLISLQSFLESTLHDIAQEVQNKIGKDLNMKEKVYKSDISFFRQIIQNSLNIKSRIEGDLWKRIDENTTIRNCLVHSNGNVERQSHKKRNKIKAILKKYDKQLILNSLGEIVIFDRQYLITYSVTIQDYCNLLFDKVFPEVKIG